MLRAVMTVSPIATIVSIAILSLTACAVVLHVLLKTGLAWRLATDIPNDRSLHTRPTPRVGGWGIVPVAVIAMLIVAPSMWSAAAGAALLAAISQIDDRRGLPVRVRFAAHLAAVALLVASHPVDVPWWALVLVSFLLLWLINLYNFMDGADGLAGGMALFGFGAYAVGAATSAYPLPMLSAASTAVAAAALGFLLFNFHPARIFLGDAGSIPLGFLAGAFGYWGWADGVWPIWFPPMVFLPFIFDASITLLKRLLRGEKVWHAHREHYYQRMIQAGLGHAKNAWYWYAIMALGTIIANTALSWSPVMQWCTVGMWVIVLGCMGIGVDARWRRFMNTAKHTK